MSTSTVDASQRRAARIVGTAYLLAMAGGIFSEAVRGHLIVADDAAETARHILSHETLFRLSIADELIVPAIDIALITALYVILKPVNQNLALAGYLKVFEADRLPALARLSIGAHGAGIGVVLVFLGLGSAVFADISSPAYMAPLGIFEVTMGFWLLIKGLREPVG